MLQNLQSRTLALLSKPQCSLTSRALCRRNLSNQNLVDERKSVLSKQLLDLNINAQDLDEAATASLERPTEGYDGRFGKSAIRAYRSFLSGDNASVAAANRRAREIDFLLKRHASHQADHVRHHDAQESTLRTTFPLVLILDNLRSAQNVGSLIRTADATGCTGVFTTGICPHVDGGGSEKVLKASLGASVPHEQHFATTQQALDHVRQSYPEYQIMALETTSTSRLYTQVNYPSTGICLILGNEVTGVDTRILEDVSVVEIPMFGSKNSLNVAACAPVILYEILRQWGKG